MKSNNCSIAIQSQSHARDLIQLSLFIACFLSHHSPRLSINLSQVGPRISNILPTTTLLVELNFHSKAQRHCYHRSRSVCAARSNGIARFASDRIIPLAHRHFLNPGGRSPVLEILWHQAVCLHQSPQMSFSNISPHRSTGGTFELQEDFFTLWEADENYRGSPT
jgi:hypothetical protein